MTFRFEILASLAAVAVIGLAAPSTGAADVTTTDTSSMDTSDGGGSADASDGSSTDVTDGGSSDATDTAGDDASDTATGDTSDTMTGDGSDTGPTDAGDIAGDTGTVDVADTAVEDTMDGGSPDTADTSDTAGDADVVDTGMEVEDTEPATAQFFGEIEVRSQPDDGGVTVAVERTDGEISREQTTDERGRFLFAGLPHGTYEVEISLENYVTIAESFELEGEREARYTLHRDQDVDVRIRAIFDHVEEPPESVTFELEGERGRRTPDDGPIAVDEGSAEWSVSELGVGSWRLTASAEDFQDVSFGFGATGPDGQPEQLDIRLYMPRANVPPPPPDTSGCTCSRETTDGGGSPGPTPTPGPVGAPILILLSVLCSRQLRSLFSGPRD